MTENIPEPQKKENYSHPSKFKQTQKPYRPLNLATCLLSQLLTLGALLVLQANALNVLKPSESINEYRDSLDQSISYSDPKDQPNKEDPVHAVVNPRYKVIKEVWIPMLGQTQEEIMNDRNIIVFFSINEWIVLVNFHGTNGKTSKVQVFYFNDALPPGFDPKEQHKVLTHITTHTVDQGYEKCSLPYFLAGSQLFLSQCQTASGLIYQGITVQGNVNFQKYMTSERDYYRVTALSSHDENLQQVLLYRKKETDIIHQYISKTTVTVEKKCRLVFDDENEKLSKIRYLGNSVILIEVKRERKTSEKISEKQKKLQDEKTEYERIYYYIPLEFGTNFMCGLIKFPLIQKALYTNTYYHDVYHCLILEFLRFTPELGPQLVAMNYNEQSSRFEILNIDEYYQLQGVSYTLHKPDQYKVYRMKHGTQFRVYIPLHIKFRDNLNVFGWGSSYTFQSKGYLSVISRADYNGILDQNFSEENGTKCYNTGKSIYDRLKSGFSYYTFTSTYCSTQFLDGQSYGKEYDTYNKQIEESNVNMHMSFELYNTGLRKIYKPPVDENSVNKNPVSNALIGRIVLIQRPNVEITTKQNKIEPFQANSDQKIDGNYYYSYVKGNNIFETALLFKAQAYSYVSNDWSPGAKIGENTDQQIWFYDGMKIEVAIKDFLTSSYISRGADYLLPPPQTKDSIPGPAKLDKSSLKREVIRLQDQQDDIYEGSFISNRLLKAQVNYDDLEYFYSFNYRDINEDKQVVNSKVILLKYKQRSKGQLFHIDNGQLILDKNVEFTGNINEVIKVGGSGALLNVEGRLYYLQLFPIVTDREVHLSGKRCDKMVKFQPANLESCLMCFQDGLQTQVYILWDLIYGRSSSSLPSSSTQFFSDNYRQYRNQLIRLDQVIFQNSVHFPNLLFVLYKKQNNLLVVYNIRVNMVLQINPYKELSIFGKNWDILDMKIINEYLVVMLNSDRIRLRFFYISADLNITLRKEFDVSNQFTLANKQMFNYQPIDIHNSFGLLEPYVALHVANETAHNVLIVRPQTGSLGTAPFMVLSEEKNQGLKLTKHFEHNQKYRGESFSFIQKYIRDITESFEDSLKQFPHTFFFAQLNGLKMIVDDRESSVDQVFSRQQRIYNNKTTSFTYWMDYNSLAKGSSNVRNFTITMMKLDDSKKKIEILPKRGAAVEQDLSINKETAKRILPEEAKKSDIIYLNEEPIDLQHFYKYYTNSDQKIIDKYTEYPAWQDIETLLRVEEPTNNLFMFNAKDYFKGDILNMTIEPESFFELETGQIKMIPAVSIQKLYKPQGLATLNKKSGQRFTFESVCIKKSQLSYARRGQIDVCDLEIETLFENNLVAIFTQNHTSFLNFKTSFPECSHPITIQESTIAAICKVQGRIKIQWVSLDLQHRFVKDIEDQVSGNVKQFSLKVKNDFLFLVAQNAKTQENIKLWIYEIGKQEEDKKNQYHVLQFEYIDQILLKSDDYHVNIFYDDPDKSEKELYNIQDSQQAVSTLPVQYLEVFTVRCPVDYRTCTLKRLMLIKKLKSGFYSKVKAIFDQKYKENYIPTTLSDVVKGLEAKKKTLVSSGLTKTDFPSMAPPQMKCKSINDFYKVTDIDNPKNGKEVYQAILTEYDYFYGDLLMPDYSQTEKEDFILQIIKLQKELAELDSLCLIKEENGEGKFNYAGQHTQKILHFNTKSSIIIRREASNEMSFYTKGVTDYESSDLLLRYPKLSSLQENGLWRMGSKQNVKLIVTLPNYHSVLVQVGRHMTQENMYHFNSDDIFHKRNQTDHFGAQSTNTMIKITNIFMGLQPNYVWYPSQYKWLYLVTYNFKNKSFIQFYNISDIETYNAKSNHNMEKVQIVDIKESISPFWVANFSLIKGMNFKEIEGHPSIIARIKLIDSNNDFQMIVVRRNSQIHIENLYIQSNYISLKASGLWNQKQEYRIKIKHYWEKDYYKYYLTILVYVGASAAVILFLGLWIAKNTPNQDLLDELEKKGEEEKERLMNQCLVDQHQKYQVDDDGLEKDDVNVQNDQNDSMNVDFKEEEPVEHKESIEQREEGQQIQIAPEVDERQQVECELSDSPQPEPLNE